MGDVLLLGILLIALAAGVRAWLWWTDPPNTHRHGPRH